MLSAPGGKGERSLLNAGAEVRLLRIDGKWAKVDLSNSYFDGFTLAGDYEPLLGENMTDNHGPCTGRIVTVGTVQGSPLSLPALPALTDVVPRP